MNQAREAAQVQSLIVEAQNLVAHARQFGRSVTIMQGPHGPLIRIKKVVGNDPSLNALPQVIGNFHPQHDHSDPYCNCPDCH